ncbi:unnamed protein product, partial [Mesorhabditis belari]|uniref:Phosphatidylinositol-glycan biosynthesis class X protein n=1 Tax=Mesorhabditis belari TaxID=2138241 RepID=A0AAF3FKX8_9BILA
MLPSISCLFLIFFWIENSHESCQFLEQIRDVEVRGSIDGLGQHRQWEIRSKVASLNRFTECRLGYELEVPKGAFLDLDTINSSLPRHFLFSNHRFNVEAPAERSRAHKIYLVGKKIFRKTFILEETLSFPLHFRYQAANKDGKSATVSFPPPKLLIDCPEDYRVWKLETCVGQLRALRGVGVATDAPTWLSLVTTNGWRSPIKIMILTGNTTFIPLVIMATIFVVFISLILLFTGSNENSHKKDE